MFFLNTRNGENVVDMIKKEVRFCAENAAAPKLAVNHRTGSTHIEDARKRTKKER